MRTPGILDILLHFFNLESEIDDFDNIHKSIIKDTEFKGTNLWILMFAIVICSVGLNMNSTAVVIGAMLISPLMGPINGIGYSIATYDFKLLNKALRNFAFAVVIGLLASTLYFALSPINTAHSELLARTSPTIYDVLIALFGGLAGIVAISSKQKGNVIPGVAIATALMPPLCTAGYGLATGRFTFFLGAFYLFFINAVFIALASVSISQILKFPIRTIVDVEQQKKTNNWISVLIILTIIPSLYFGFKLIQKEKFLDHANRYINNISIIEGNYLLKNEIDPKNRTIYLTYGGRSLDDNQKNRIKKIANDFSLHKTKIEFTQGLTFENNKYSELQNLETEIFKLTQLLNEKDKQINNYQENSLLGTQLMNELQIFFPKISNVLYGKAFTSSEEPNQTQEYIFFAINSQEKIFPPDKIKITNWLKKRFNTENIKILFES